MGSTTLKSPVRHKREVAKGCYCKRTKSSNTTYFPKEQVVDHWQTTGLLIAL